ncbi:IS110 family transposase [Acinetobacter oleivorans]
MNYLGIDVSKDKIDCCLLINDISKKGKAKIFPNNEGGFNKLVTWLNQKNIQYSDLLVTLEATGIYHENLCYFLNDLKIKIAISNPMRTRRFAQGMSILNKTDKVDSEVLAKYGALAPIKLWQPDSENFRELCDLMVRRDALSTDLVRENNRLEKSMFTTTSKQVITMIQENMQHIQSYIDQIDNLIDQLIKRDADLSQEMQLLTSIPAIGQRTALQMLNLFHGKDFESAGSAAAYVGLVPVQKQSGTSVRGATKISKAGSSRIRSALYMAAIVAIRFNPHTKVLYDRLLKNGKSKMSALCAVMRKLVYLCYGVLKHKIPYQADYALKFA